MPADCLKCGCHARYDWNWAVTCNLTLTDNKDKYLFTLSNRNIDFMNIEHMARYYELEEQTILIYLIITYFIIIIIIIIYSGVLIANI